MAEDSKELDSNANADDHQEVPTEKPPGPKGAGAWSEDGVQPARGGGSPAGPLKAEPDPPKPDEKEVSTKGTGTHEGEVGPGRG